MKKKGRILIVDDEIEIVETLQHFLSKKGYETKGAFSGKEALEILEKDKMDLILLDITMPDIDGAEVAKIARNKYPAIKLIIITAYPDKGKDLSNNISSEGLFIKPVGLHNLYNKLLDVLNQEEEENTIDSSAMQAIKARVLLIKAKLLFIEPEPGVNEFLISHFKDLTKQGEDYEIEIAFNFEEAAIKLKEFNADIAIFNMSYFNSVHKDLADRIYNSSLGPKELLFYKSNNSKQLDQSELGRLIKAVRTFCLKNGLLDIKWIRI